MSDTEWRPLFDRMSGEPSDFDVLHEGIPKWLEGSLWRWLMDRAAEGGPSLIERLERRLRLVMTHEGDRPLGAQHTPPNALIERYWQAASATERLTFLDALVRDLQLRASDAMDHGAEELAEDLVKAAERLDTILSDGSVWSAHVGHPAWGLVRRANEGTTFLVAAASSPETDAARKIKSAWMACYRQEPNYDVAYRDAVLAVEAVTIPATIPASPRATLGQAVAHVRDTVHMWSVGGLDAPEIASGETLLAMLKTLWHNQERHARIDGAIVDVTSSEAEAAVTLAVTLVHWFSSGLVQKHESKGSANP